MVRSCRLNIMVKCIAVVLVFVFVNSITAGAQEKYVPIKVKGLYLGMDIYKAKDVINQHPDGSEYEVEETVDKYSNKPGYVIGDVSEEPLYLYAGEDRRLERMLMVTSLTNKLFNTHDLKGEEFAQAFAKAYGIPVMKLFKKKVGEELEVAGWTFTDKSGVKIIIFDDKSIIMEKVPTPEELTFD